MESKDAAAVVGWLRDLGLAAAATAAESAGGVDGSVLVALATEAGGLECLGVVNLLHVAKIKGGIARLGREADGGGSRGSDGGRPAKRARSSAPFSPPSQPPAAVAVAAAAAPVLEVAKVSETGADGRTAVYVRRPPDYLECAICTALVMSDPHVIKGGCTHSFCRDCLLQCMERKRECPKCKQPPVGVPAGAPVAATVQRNTDMCGAASAEKIHCPGGVKQMADGSRQWCVDPVGCTAELRGGELAAHVAACAHAPAVCAQSAHGCGWAGKRGDLAGHAAACVFVKLRPALEEIAALKTEQAVTKVELAAAKTELAAAKTEQAGTKTKLAVLTAGVTAYVPWLLWDRGDPYATSRGLARLANSVVDNDPASRAFGAAGGVQAVLAALRAHPAHAGVQASGCVALNNLLFENTDTNVAAAHADGAAAVVTSALAAHRTDVLLQEYGCHVLGLLAQGNLKHAAAVQAAGGVEAACAAMRGHLAVPAVLQWACYVLGHVVSTDHTAAAAIRAQGAVAMAEAAKAAFPGEQELVGQADFLLERL